jgi:hypothetical protein
LILLSGMGASVAVGALKLLLSRQINAVTNSERNQEMTRTKLGLLSLCVMLFGLTALNVAGASAARQWLFAEKAGTGLVPFLEAEIELKKDSVHYVLHSEILKIPVLFLCTGISADAKLISEGRIGTNGQPKGAKVLFSGCITELKGSVAPECVPTDKTTGKGTITTLPGHAVLATHVVGGATEDILIVLPDDEILPDPVFAHIELPEGCPIGTKVPVIGKLALKDCQKLGLTHLVEHLVEAYEPLTKLFTISLTEEHKATILGSAWAFLKGAHLGFKFSGDPV